MTKETFKTFALALGLSGLALIPSTTWAQVGLASSLPGRGLPSTAALAASHRTQSPGSPSSSYTYTLLSFPGTLSTSAYQINLGATTSKTEIVGGYGPIEDNQGGFLVRVSGKKTVTESYKAVNYPHTSAGLVNDINDSGQIVGEYVNGDGNWISYELSGGEFTTIAVPGSVTTQALGISNSGEIVGTWFDANTSHGFTLIGGTYTSLDYPGAGYTSAFAVNSAGDITGYYGGANGIVSGYLLSGGTYTSFAFPGAAVTNGYGINDSGDIVGLYCTNSCNSGFLGAQGFLLSQGVFTTIAIPGEAFTYASGINNNGEIVGVYEDAAGLVASFLATP